MATTVTLKPNAIDISGSTSGTTTLQATAVAGTTTITLPAATDTLVGKATTDTLTNKTLTTPVISSLSSASATALTLQSAGTTAVTIDTSQNVGIGTTSPSTYVNSQGATLVVGASPNWATIQNRSDGPSGAANGVSYGGSYSTNPINGARMFIAASGGAGQRGIITFNTKELDDNTTQPLERMRIDSSGNVGIGTSSPSGKLAVSTAQSSIISTSTTGTNNVLFQQNNTGGSFNVALENSSGGSIASGTSAYSAVLSHNGAYPIAFCTSNTERMRIDSSGNLLVNRTTVYNSEKFGVTYSSNSGACAIFNDTNPQNGNTFLQFRNGGTTAGSITSNGTTTMTYGSASDYRLKKDLVPMTGALSKIALLKPRVGKWIADDSEFQGFIAHELQEVFSDAVVGEKDKVDADGNLEYQMIDAGSASLIATLTAAIQELKAINDTQAETINALTARIVALEAK